MKNLELSPSSRRAWIEILFDVSTYMGLSVALLAEGVDRNIEQACTTENVEVALLAEGVDRNNTQQQGDPTDEAVALLAEGVDRNQSRSITALADLGRPPRGGRG